PGGSSLLLISSTVTEKSPPAQPGGVPLSSHSWKKDMVMVCSLWFGGHSVSGDQVTVPCPQDTGPPAYTALAATNINVTAARILHIRFIFPSYGITHCPTTTAPPVLNRHRSPAWGSMSRSDPGPALLGKAPIIYPQKKRPRIVSA